MTLSEMLLDYRLYLLEKLATMEKEDYEHYTDEDREAMRNRISEVEREIAQ